MPFDGSELSQTKRDLIAARQLLLDEGWCPQEGRLGGPHCIITALVAVSDAPVHARQIIVGFLPSPYVAAWNDAQTSIEPVLALLDEAIAAA
jgi:hypothetical protein